MLRIVALVLLLQTGAGLTALGAPARLGKHEIREAGSKDASARYIAPNEHESRLFVPYLRGAQGALISVGTFRTLNDAAHGDFSTVIMLDYAERTTKFNRANLKLIAASKDRYEYLTRLFARDLDADVLEKARGGKLKDVVFMRELKAAPRLSDHRWTDEQRAALDLVESPEFRHDKRLRRISQSLQLGLELGILHFLDKPGRWDAAFWSSDARFEKIQGLIAEKRIVAVLGDLSGAGTMTDLAHALKARGEQVGVLDLSNALDYIVPPNKGDRFLKNLERLPWAGDALVLFTNRAFTSKLHERMGKVGYGDGWAYYVTSHERFMRGARAGALESPEKVDHFYSALQEASLRQSERDAQLIVSEKLERESCPRRNERLLTQP